MELTIEISLVQVPHLTVLLVGRGNVNLAEIFCLLEADLL